MAKGELNTTNFFDLGNLEVLIIIVCNAMHRERYSGSQNQKTLKTLVAECKLLLPNICSGMFQGAVLIILMWEGGLKLKWLWSATASIS